MITIIVEKKRGDETAAGREKIICSVDTEFIRSAKLLPEKKKKIKDLIFLPVQQRLT